MLLALHGIHWQYSPLVLHTDDAAVAIRYSYFVGKWAGSFTLNMTGDDDDEDESPVPTMI